jgi:hypothetical protein
MAVDGGKPEFTRETLRPACGNANKSTASGRELRQESARLGNRLAQSSYPTSTLDGRPSSKRRLIGTHQRRHLLKVGLAVVGSGMPTARALFEPAANERPLLSTATCSDVHACMSLFSREKRSPANTQPAVIGPPISSTTGVEASRQLMAAEGMFDAHLFSQAARSTVSAHQPRKAIVSLDVCLTKRSTQTCV